MFTHGTIKKWVKFWTHSFCHKFYASLSATEFVFKLIYKNRFQGAIWDILTFGAICPQPTKMGSFCDPLYC